MVLVWLQCPTEDCSIAVIWLIINSCFFLFSPQIEEGRPLPSPSHLKRKIIIKNKKLKPEQEMEGEKIILFSYISYWGKKNYFLLYFDKYRYFNLFFSRPNKLSYWISFLFQFLLIYSILAWEKKEIQWCKVSIKYSINYYVKCWLWSFFPFRFQWIA